MIDAVALLTADRERTALLTDFDGSLSEIVDHPDDAVPRPEVVGLLGALVAQFGLVAVVSGRPVEFLQTHLPVPGLDLIGQYGLERLVAGRVVEVDGAQEYVEVMAHLAARAERELPGVYVERKGRVSVALHWRMAASGQAAVQHWSAVEAGAAGLELYPGRMTVELRPPIPVDKGSVVESLVAGWSVAAFAGDDRGDLAAFAALAAAARDGVLDAVVRVGVRSAEEPPELAANCDVLVDGPRGLVEWFSALVAPV